MWLWAGDLHRAGFRRRSPRYWRCDRGHGLPAAAYVSAFADARLSGTGGWERVDLPAFHVTFPAGADRVHFYYHESGDAAWEPGGHTPGPEVRRHGLDPAALRAVADRVAARVAAALGAGFRPRDELPADDE